MSRLTKQQKKMISIKRLRKTGLSVKEIALRTRVTVEFVIEQLRIASPEYMVYESIMPTAESIARDNAILDIFNEDE